MEISPAPAAAFKPSLQKSLLDLFIDKKFILREKSATVYLFLNTLLTHLSTSKYSEETVIMSEKCDYKTSICDFLYIICMTKIPVRKIKKHAV
jgi:hypothetical protein